MPTTFAKTFVAPPGSASSATSEPMRPLATSLTVPSPPRATTASKPSGAAARASSIAWPWRCVSTAAIS